MGIKLSDFIKDPHNVFTQEEAEMIYLAAGYADLGNDGDIKSVEVIDNIFENKHLLEGTE